MKIRRDAFLLESALVELPRFEGETVLVGDLHGQFRDLRNILATVGHPGPGRRYVFLGDYVDRGECGLEIVACLFALKLRYPDRVYLIRGNHECAEVTVMFGFCMECQRRSTLAVWEAVMQVFDALPLAALLHRQVLCVHGGISPQLSRLEEINSIARPTDVNPAGAGLLVDLLWADPCTHTPGWCHSPRGVSYCFGLSAVREFQLRTGVRSIVRAHMMQPEGFEVLGNHEVVTVFSAVNYKDSGNTGAVVVLDADNTMHFRTFLPPARDQGSPLSVLRAAAVSSATESASTADAAGAQQSSFSEDVGVEALAGQETGGWPGNKHTPPPELVALEEVAEDLRAVRQQQGSTQPGTPGAGICLHGSAAPPNKSGPDGESEWRYALPLAVPAGAVDVAVA
ncbi:hypothetical protein N2152v2_007434 [Parachlorella kessleri]